MAHQLIEIIVYRILCSKCRDMLQNKFKVTDILLEKVTFIAQYRRYPIRFQIRHFFLSNQKVVIFFIFLTKMFVLDTY